MTQAGADNWKTPLGYYERAIYELTKTREEFQAELQNLRELQAYDATVKAKLQTIQTELETIKTQLQATKAELETDIQGTNTQLNSLKENLYQSFKSIFVKAPDDKKHNATCSSSWETVLSYELNLTAPSYVNVLAHGHGFTYNYNSALDIRIFINGSQFDDGFWGLGITHSPSWQTLVCLFLKYLNSGNHLIEVKYRSRHGDGVNWVHFNYPSILIMLNGSEVIDSIFS